MPKRNVWRYVVRVFEVPRHSRQAHEFKYWLVLDCGHHTGRRLLRNPDKVPCFLCTRARHA